MAFSSTIFLLFSLAAASTIAHSLVLPGTVEVIIVGRLLCTATGNPVTGILDAPVAGANVTLSCNGGETYLAQVFTDPNGFYLVVLSTADALVLNYSECAMFIQLPAGNCPTLPSTGTLRAPLSTFRDPPITFQVPLSITIPVIGGSVQLLAAGQIV